MTLRTYPEFHDKSLDGLQKDLKKMSYTHDSEIVWSKSVEARMVYKKAFYPNVREVSANTTFGPDDWHIDVNATGGAITINLPDDETIGCRHCVVSKSDASANAVTIEGQSKNINGAGTASISSRYGVKRFHFLPTADEWREV